MPIEANTPMEKTQMEIIADCSWTILVHGYGAFEFRGSREAAEEAKTNKARWENSAARLWANSPRTEVERIEKEIGEEFRDHGCCAIALLNRLSVARKAAA